MIYSDTSKLALKLKKYKIGVTCCDAGSANIIFDFLHSLSINHFLIYIEGPAINICKAKFPNKINMTLNVFLDEIDFLITGTSWSSSIEHDIRLIAKSRNIRTVATLDHWTSYKERFQFNSQFILPDEIWVFDKYALNIAKKEFKKTPIALLKNFYLENQIKNIKLKSNLKNFGQQKIVYISEPIRTKWLENEICSGEFQALNFFVKNLKILNIKYDCNFILRLHPSEKKEKYVNWLSSTNFLKKEISTSCSPISDHLSDADLVLGCQSNLLAIALLAGKKVISTLPPWAPSCCLPQPGIMHLKTFPGVNI